MLMSSNLDLICLETTGEFKTDLEKPPLCFEFVVDIIPAAKVERICGLVPCMLKIVSLAESLKS